ncbi:MAG TPA: PPOX class F420-dependent oxidoreductase [Ktedonobacterales bacterium]|jgi:pyridoxamine 5'-phosphate oxidase family protein|nr:PPOX class F420-dependent oxidoreductase [Ktedonobacterales bacterium]
MSSFSEAEIAYIKSQRLGRLATVNAAGEPHVVPVGFRYNPATDTIDIGGHGIGGSRKYRDATARPMVAFVVDDVLPPWQPRGIEIRGRAEALATGGKAIMAAFDDELIRITPTRIVGWGIESDGRFNSRNAG